MKNFKKIKIQLMLLMPFLTMFLQASIDEITIDDKPSNYAKAYPHLSQGFKLLHLNDSDHPSFNEFMKERLIHYNENDPIDFRDTRPGFSEIFHDAICQAEDIIFKHTIHHFMSTLKKSIELKNDNIHEIQDPIFQYVIKYHDHFMHPILKHECINKKDDRGQLLLYYAAHNNMPCTIQLLISAGADVNCDNFYRHNPLYEATCSHAIESIQILLNNGANPNIAGWTALHVAAKENNVKLIQMLLAAGANINLKNCDFGDYTPLHCAVYWNAIDATQALMSAGADAMIIDSKDKIAQEYAKTPEMKLIFRISYVNRIRNLICYKKNK